MPRLGTLSVRADGIGGHLTKYVSEDPPHWMMGHRHIVLLIHGFNTNYFNAVSSYDNIFSSTLADVGHFFWPGDTAGGAIHSSLSYPWQIDTAKKAAILLSDYICRLVGPDGGPMSVSFVAHSLGCRLTLETLKLIAKRRPLGIRIRVVALMAAAVPIELVYPWEPLELGARLASRLILFHSFNDETLRLAFPPGQAAAALFGIETKSYLNAIGRFGEPSRIATEVVQKYYDHSDYWPDRSAAVKVAGLLGKAVRRELPSRISTLSSRIENRPPIQPRITPRRLLLTKR